MNAVIYARYSSDNQREESIEGQLRECKEYADPVSYTHLFLTSCFPAWMDTAFWKRFGL